MKNLVLLALLGYFATSEMGVNAIKVRSFGDDEKEEAGEEVKEEEKKEEGKEEEKKEEKKDEKEHHEEDESKAEHGIEEAEEEVQKQHAANAGKSINQIKVEQKVGDQKKEDAHANQEDEMNAGVQKEKDEAEAAFEESERKRIYYDPTQWNVHTDGDHATANMPESSVTLDHGPIPHGPF